MTFIFQDIINVGIQILGIIGLGWLFSRWGLIDQARFMPQVNLLILQVCGRARGYGACGQPHSWTASGLKDAYRGCDRRVIVRTHHSTCKQRSALVDWGDLAPSPTHRWPCQRLTCTWLESS